MLAKIKVRYTKIYILEYLISMFHCLYTVLTLWLLYVQRGGAIRQELAKLKKEVAA